MNDYHTKNINKAAYLLINGATFKGFVIENDPIATVILDNVNSRHRDNFWKDDVIVELWTFLRMRNWLKKKIKQEMQSRKY